MWQKENKKIELLGEIKAKSIIYKNVRQIETQMENIVIDTFDDNTIIVCR